jgi:hypothetical protein
MNNFSVSLASTMADYQICLLDIAGMIICEQTVPHTGSGMMQFVDWLAEHVSQPGQVAVAIEAPLGAMIAALLEGNYVVFAINLKQLDRRDRHTVAGAKDDRIDAFVLADSVRNESSLICTAQHESQFTFLFILAALPGAGVCRTQPAAEHCGRIGSQGWCR